jgi:hypothetical protein
LKAAGADRATRALEVLGTTLASEANATRDRRPDGAVTLIKAGAAAGAAPIEDQRLLHASMLLGGLSILTFGLGSVLWLRLAKAKHDFEVSAQLDQVMDEAKWAELAAATTSQRPRT